MLLIEIIRFYIKKLDNYCENIKACENMLKYLLPKVLEGKQEVITVSKKKNDGKTALSSRLHLIKLLKSPDYDSKSVETKNKFRNISENIFKKPSFIETQDNSSLLELSSMIDQNAISNMKNILDLEEKRIKTRKALFNKRYLKEYPIDYKPKALTTSKCQ